MANRNLKLERISNPPASDKAPSGMKEIGPKSKVRTFDGPSIKSNNSGPTDAPYYDKSVPAQSK